MHDIMALISNTTNWWRRKRKKGSKGMRRRRRRKEDQEMNRWTPSFSTYFRSCPVNPAFSTRVNINEHKTFYQLWMIELRERDKDSCETPTPHFL